MKRLPKSLKFEYRISSSGDSWGGCLSWRFALADYLTERGIPVPSSWHFRQGIGRAEKSYEFKELARRNDSKGTLLRFGAILKRLQSILEAQGKGY